MDPMERMQTFAQRMLDTITNTKDDAEEDFDMFNKSFWKQWRPPLDIVDDKDAIKITVDLPGVKKDEINLEVIGNVLILSGNRPCPDREVESKLYHWERRCGPFQRTIALPRGATQDKIKAKYDEGVLDVEIPKPEKEDKKTIHII